MLGFFKKLIIYLATLGLHCYVQAFSSAESKGYSLVAVHRLLICDDFSYCRAQALGHMRFMP